MTPKKKAKELVKQYTDICEIRNHNHFNILAKQCALILVDEIQKNFVGLHKPEYCCFDAIGERSFTFKGEYEDFMTGYDMIDYWDIVRKEIEKL